METMDDVDDVLAHFGVKGMRWGVRKAPTARQEDFRRAAKEGKKKVTVRAEPGKKIKTKGGKGVEASDDAIRAAVIKRVAKGSKPSALSNDELRTAIQRMQLEQQFRDLNKKSSTVGRGQAAVKEMIGVKTTMDQASKASEGIADAFGKGKK